MVQIPACIFCSIATKLKENVIWEDDLFWIIYDGFPIAEPHLLIIPKSHILCYGQLSPTEFPHVQGIMRLVQKKIAGPVLFFEHGDIGQTVKHAHLHAIPFEGTVDDAIALVNLPGTTKSIADFSDVAKYPQYLLFIGGHMTTLLPEVGTTIAPAPITNSLAKAFGKPVPAANRPPPSRESVETVRNAFRESSHGS